ncbi:MAG TPA: hypothetical protein DEQ51_02130 [Alphaproteobacteria bacterium]|nr:hypothetical protein [Alphaproteobacteria bacterium]
MKAEFSLNKTRAQHLEDAFTAQLLLLFSKNLKMVAQQFLMGYATFSIMIWSFEVWQGENRWQRQKWTRISG